MNNAFHQGDRGMDILHREVALEAIHDSEESFPQPKCHPETRTKMLEDLHACLLDPQVETGVVWLWGPAGAGKSAIMQTLAGRLQDAGGLGGSFFFKRGHPVRGSGKRLFATIAFQLAVSVPWLRSPISQVVEKDSSIVTRRIDTQMQRLISDPCRLHADENSAPVAILIDGLDECEGHGNQLEILRAIFNFLSNHPTPFRFIVASRPEPHIREMFDSPAHHDSYQSFNVEQSFVDVRKYLEDEFSRIRCEHATMARIPSPWPSVDVVEDLVQSSSGHFIYAATIIKFIDDKNYRPKQRLAMVQDGSSPQSKAAFDALDHLYLTILRSAPRSSELIPILCALANFDLTSVTVDHLLGFEDGDAQLLLRGLHSVFHIPPQEYVFGKIVAHHASFLDFLDNASRSQEFYVGTPNLKMDLARSFLEFCAGDHREGWTDYIGPHAPAQNLFRFITSLPPSVELCSIIERMNARYIFETFHGVTSVLAWLKKFPSASPQLITLWEDYAYMTGVRKLFSDTDDECGLDWDSIRCERITSCPKLFQAFVVMAFLGDPLSYVRDVLDIAWEELRGMICSLRPNNIRNQQPLLESVVQSPLPPAIHPQFVYRDLALQCIRVAIAPDNSRDHVERKFGLLVRSCPPCLVLLREVCCSLPLAIFAKEEDYSGDGFDEMVYHISKWMEPFPDPSLAATWKQVIARQRERPCTAESVVQQHTERWEEAWRRTTQEWNELLGELHLHPILEIPSKLKLNTR
ncbi:hypothetical protein C8R45DRAFT_1017669 [Mycena sanguinolenta]|nr:hypothetical protein C8R45DRAFT_1017669 [Mycena sanguinolenta]